MKNKKVLIWSGIIVLILITAAILYQASLFESTSYFYDKDLGTITITIKEVNWLTNILGNKQTSFEPFGVIDLGESTTLRNYITISPDSNPVAWLRTTIYKDGSKYEDIDTYLFPNIQPGRSFQKDVSWTPTETGKYTLATYIKCEVAAPLKTCSGAWFKVGDPLEAQIYGELTVRNPVVECNKDDYCSQYNVETTIANGNIYSKECFSVTADCEYDGQGKDYETRCDSGYTITGKTTTIEPGQTTCSIAITPHPAQDCVQNPALCVAPKTCKIATKTCEAPECNVDKTVTCLSGITIITDKCTNGIYVSTTDKCPEVNQTDPCSSCTSTQTCVNKVCVNLNGTIVIPPNPPVETPQDDSVLYVIVGGVAVLAVYLGYLITKKKFK